MKNKSRIEITFERNIFKQELTRNVEVSKNLKY